ncbi:MAG: tetratricopeptide repeat protein [Burkholderiaceae bacterium]|jgi:hypothetical protein|nr:tetratricopeptide repeat protein [Burkholderiaceae bacterium]
MEKTSTSQNPPKDQLSADNAAQRVIALHGEGRYQESLDLCLQITRDHPENPYAWCNAAVNCIGLTRWQDAIRYGETALACGANMIELYDALAHVHGHLRHWDEARRYGLQALNMRDRLFGGEPVIPLPEPGPLPPLPSAQTREHNIIAFSLFGRDLKYCESAVLNVQEQPDIYPHWICRFYVDGSVPGRIIERLRTSGAQIVHVEGPALQWPGQMWRFLALDDPQAHRILFRDADSVISRREAGTVEQWLTSGKRFHIIRDNGSHTELILAGLWGVVAGSLPPLEQLMQRFLSVPLASRHFADQYFLRQYVWPYARTSLMQHDWIFGFMDALPFPDGPRPEDFHVGYMESDPSFTAEIDLPDGSEVTWGLFKTEKLANGQNREVLVCSYPGTVKDGMLIAHIPTRYLRWVDEGTARMVWRKPRQPKSGAA